MDPLLSAEDGASPPQKKTPRSLNSRITRYVAALIISRLERAAHESNITQQQRVALTAFLLPEAFADQTLPARPTSCAPGTPEKAEIMRLRAKRGERLWHPDDSEEGLLPLDPHTKRRRSIDFGAETGVWPGVSRTGEPVFRARVVIDRRRVSLGCYPTYGEAAAAVREARRGAEG